MAYVSKDKERETRRKYMRAYSKRDYVKKYFSEKANAYHKRPEQRQQYLARKALNNALTDGKIIKPTVCDQDDKTCTGRIEAHHPDYSKPLEVLWLCRSHHDRLHGKLKS